MRCDAHVHLWDPARSPYAWLDHAQQDLQRAFAPEEVVPALQEQGFDHLVLVQADDTREDTAHLQRCAREIPLRHAGIARAGVVAWLPLAQPELVRGLLADPEAMDGVVGVRHLTHDDPDPFFLRREDVGQSLDLIADAGLPLDVPDSFPAQLAYLPDLAAEHPGLDIVVDHLGKPPLGGHAGALRTWREMLARAAGCDRIMAKASGLATSGVGEAGDIAEALEEARSLFGAERLLYGSDWPIAPVAGDYAAGTGPVLAHVSTWPDAQQDLVLGGNARRVYRWES